MDLRASAIGSLQSAGWLFSPAPAGAWLAPAALGRAHSSVASWVSSFSRLSSADEATWFLSTDDYAGTTTDEFAWNEFETISLDAASTDEERAAVADFWTEHFPILLSARGHYGYLAVRRDGAIVHGEEPEFEQTRVVASDLDKLLEVISFRPTPGDGRIESLMFDVV
ncbi:hypothetical protein [Micromonospora sp. NPDC049900]|uniref:hypothetical protein n=1 Tax=unclassified Micromonospora TaxID=2617518 RepID=UPI0037BCA4D7